jgi:hypothetical protein
MRCTSLTCGNVGSSHTRNNTAETARPGWAERTRTRKRRIAALAIACTRPEPTDERGNSRQTRILVSTQCVVKMTFASSNPLTPATESVSCWSFSSLDASETAVSALAAVRAAGRALKRGPWFCWRCFVGRSRLHLHPLCSLYYGKPHELGHQRDAGFLTSRARLASVE